MQDCLRYFLHHAGTAQLGILFKEIKVEILLEYFPEQDLNA